MIINLILILFLLGVILLSATYGFFSAFLHLCAVIACGALALAIWEPLVVGFLLPNQPDYAWAVGLLGPFALLLLGARFAIDSLAPYNVNFQDLVNKIGGGLCGLGSGLLTAGIVVLGIGFLPLAPSLAGYQPYGISATGEIVENDATLWIPVDQYAADFFATLSGGAFAPIGDTPLAQANPDLAAQASLVRLRPDVNASITAVPASVSVTDAYLASAAPPEIPPAIEEQWAANRSLLVVDTAWANEPGTYDTDSVLRLAPAQVRLLLREPNAEGVTAVSPVAYSRVLNFNTGERRFEPLTSNNAMIYGLTGRETLGLMFLIPRGAEPLGLRIRNLPLPLPDSSATDEAELQRVIGEPAPPESESDAGDDQAQDSAPSIGEQEGVVAGMEGVSIEVTSALPRAISANNTRSLSLTPDNSQVTGGEGSVAPGAGGQRTTASAIQTPSHLGSVRLQVQRDQARSLLGGAMEAAAGIGGVYLSTSRGTSVQPIAWVLLKPDGTQQIWVNFNQPVRALSELPVNEMGEGDELYLYFRVPRGQSVDSLTLGDETNQQIDLTIPDN